MDNKTREERDKALFNKISDGYFRKDVYVVSSKARKFQLMSLIELYRKIKNDKGLGAILELGCGVGAGASYLKGLYKKYTGIDYSENFIEIARKKYLDGNTNFYCKNIKDIQSQEKDIDFVFGVGILHHADDIDSVLKNIKNIGHPNTLFGFIEPQASNPFVQLLRKIRMKTDKSYSPEQIFFKKSFINNLFQKNGYEVICIRYQGYFSTPFAQVILKPAFIFGSLLALALLADRLIQKYVNNPLAWNIIWIAKKTEH